jgi:uncharacterized protein YgiM (DUF1202 family)
MNKLLFLLSLLLIAVTTLKTLCFAGDSGEFITKETINVRSKPSASGKILGSIGKSETVTVVDTENGWAKISYVNNNGYVKKTYLNKSQKSKSFSTEPGLIIVLILVSSSVLFMIVKILLDTKYKPIIAEQLSESSTDIGNNELAFKYLEDIYESWSVAYIENGEEFKKPSTKSQFKYSFELIEKVKHLKPSDFRVIERMNQLGDVINDNRTRVWDGSYFFTACWVLLIISALFSSGVSMEEINSSFIMPLLMASILIVPILFLILSQLAPKWRVTTNKSSATSFMAGAAKNVAGTYHVTTYKSGRTEVEATGAKAALGLLVLGVAIDFFLLPIKASYMVIRNYINS